MLHSCMKVTCIKVMDHYHILLQFMGHQCFAYPVLILVLSRIVKDYRFICWIIEMHSGWPYSWFLLAGIFYIIKSTQIQNPPWDWQNKYLYLHYIFLVSWNLLNHCASLNALLWIFTFLRWLVSCFNDSAFSIDSIEVYGFAYLNDINYLFFGS